MSGVLVVSVNGAVHRCEPGATVASVIASLRDDPTGCAVALNRAVVPKSVWGETALESGDALEVLGLAPGG